MNDEMNYSADKAGLSKPSRATQPVVDLFPVLNDRRMMPMGSLRQQPQASTGTQISIFAPASFEEALDIVECLRGRAATTISLEKMKKVDASRLVDFVAGASAALDGDFHKLSEQVYLFCPSNIKITASKHAEAIASEAPDDLGALDFLSNLGTQQSVWTTGNKSTTH